jgi:hypothetical protein
MAHILWNKNVHYCVHKIPWLVPILSQLYLVHAFQNNFNIIFPCTPKSSTWSRSFRFPHQMLLTCKQPRISHVPPPRPPISSSLIWPPELYFVRNTNHEAPHCAVLSSLLLLRPAWARISYLPQKLLNVGLRELSHWMLLNAQWW